MMNQEEWDRQIEILLKNQAQFDIDMRKIEATQAETSEFLARVTDNLAKQSFLLFESFGLTKAEIQALNAKIDAQVQELKRSQQLTDQRVDRLTGEGLNGSQN